MKRLYYIVLILCILAPMLLSCSRNITIADTPVVTKEVRKIAELFTMAYYDECVVEHVVKRRFPLRDKKLVLIARGKVVAGFDLKSFGEKNFVVDEGNEKKVTVFLDKPKILSVIVNPSGFETFIDRGKMNFSERKKAQAKAKELLRQAALEKNILGRSEEKGKKVMNNFFRAIGFNSVSVVIQ